MDTNMFPSIGLYDKLITFEVGFDKVKFDVHLGLIRHYMPGLDALQGKDTLKALKAKASKAFEDENPKVFQAFFNWLYTRRLVNSDNVKFRMDDCQLCSRIWVFVKSYGIPELQNTAMDLLISHLADKHRHFSGNEILWIYERTARNSPLRQLAVDSFATHQDLGIRLEGLRGADEIPTNFLLDVVLELSFWRPRPTTTKSYWELVDKTKYHVPFTQAKEV
ncbi:hypothetical protein MBLNU459_g7251t2 [Dothideomycetes sp. NU459]